jgi:hypothetical protein
MKIEWKIKYGDQEVPLTVQDVIESIGRAVGLMFYDLETNEMVKSNVKMKIVREMDIQTLEFAKGIFAGVIEEYRRTHLHMSIPGKKPRRQPGHAIQGKPGDIVEITPKKEQP